MHTVRFGIMSTAGIGVKKVIPALRKSRFCTVEGIASRAEASARDTAAELDIPRSFGSYESLLASTDIDAVYIPLPNHLHVEWAVKALRAGKHVLCEKPLGMDSAEVRYLQEQAIRHPDLKIMEAFMYRFHPQWIEVRRLVDSGALGEVRAIQSFFSYFNNDPNNIRNKVDLGGGAMMDIGCYCISLSRFLFDAEPDRVCGLMDRDPDFGTDRTFSGMMDFSGRMSTFTCSTQLEGGQRVHVLGTRGRVEILIPFNAPPDASCEILLQQEKETRTVKFDVCDQYTLQGDLFAQSILEKTTTPTPLNDALANMLAHEALIQSAKEGVWIRPVSS